MGNIHANTLKCEVRIVNELDVGRLDVVSRVMVCQAMVPADG